MPQLILDPSVLDKLAALKGAVQLCYPDGRVVGDFVPKSAAELLAAWPALSEEEVARRIQEGGRSLAEILADLEKRK